jgi:hypothetical protein
VARFEQYEYNDANKCAGVAFKALFSPGKKTLDLNSQMAPEWDRHVTATNIDRQVNDSVVIGHLPVHAVEIQDGIVEHPQIYIDRFGTLAPVVNLNRHHVVRRQTGSFGRNDVIVKSQVLIESRGAEDIGSGADHVDMHVTATAGVVRVCAGETD